MADFAYFGNFKKLAPVSLIIGKDTQIKLASNEVLLRTKGHFMVELYILYVIRAFGEFEETESQFLRL